VSRPHVVVVGGGLAGLSAAIACVDAGVRVTLLEGRTRLGGATWSTRHQDLDIDNGQHVFLRCCSAYRDFVKRLGVEERVYLQPRLAVPVIAPGSARVHWLRRSPLPTPLHLAPSLLTFGHLPAKDRLRAALTAQRLGALDLEARELDDTSFGDWLRAQGASPRLIDGFWDLLIRPTVNLPAEDASLALAAKVVQTGLLERADNADIGWAREPLARVHAEPALAELTAAGAEVRLRARVDRIESSPKGPSVWRGGERLDVDAVVLAVDHEAVPGMLDPSCGVDTEGLSALGRSPIVNLHVVFDRQVSPYEFVAAVDSPLEWIFDRTRAAGLESGQYLAVSLSAADRWVGVSNERLSEVFLPAFVALFPEAKAARVERFFATCERAATFRQGPHTWRHRPPPQTRSRGIVLAGAWTDTKWPATMEGAVRSGLAGAREALLAAGVTRALPALAA